MVVTMKIAIYPGSFNPWHDGHADVLEKALQVFDKVVIAQGVNPEKKMSDVKVPSYDTYGKYGDRVQLVKFRGLLSDFIEGHTDYDFTAIVRGLRNSQDLEFERAQQYWNEDLGVGIPTVYFVTARELTHISSSALRIVAALKGER
jgi:pantetheine-phosphate adenylyltransferase